MGKMKKFKSLITEFSQESEVIHSWEGSFTGGYLGRIGIEDVEISSGQPLDRGEFLGKEVTIIIGDSESEVPKQELPIIPKYVADWIEETKQDERPLYSVMSSLMNKTNHEWAIWKSANKNFSEIVAQAWLDGYTVEEAQKYYVDLDEVAYLAKWNGNDQVDIYTADISGSDELEFYLTEEEIKNYDERFWPFAEPVE